MMVSDNYFCHPIFWMMAAANIAVDIVSIYVYRSLPEWDPETAERRNGGVRIPDPGLPAGARPGR